MFLNFSQNSEENTCAEVFLITLERPATLLEKRLWHKCFSVNYTKFLRRTCLENTFRRLLLERMQKTTKQLVKTTNHNKVYCMLWSCHVRVLEWIYTPYLFECQRTTCLKQAPYLKLKWQQRDLNPQPLSS